MFRFENIEYLYALLAVPLFFIIYLINRRIQKRNMARFGDFVLVKALVPEASSFKPHFKFWFAMLAYIVLVFTIANPQIGTKIEEIKREGVEIIIAMDVSNSMDAEDIKPSRLERAKNSVIKLIDKLSNDKIGLIIFAGDSFLQLPLTTDYSAAKMLVSSLDTEMVQTQGTAIGSAIKLASESFSSNVKNNKALIVFSDGENHEDDALGEAKTASENGIVIYTIGVGSTEGSPIPEYARGRQIGFKKDKDGNTVVTKMNPGMLQEISSVAKGTFAVFSNSDPDLKALIDDLTKLEKEEFDTAMATDFEDRFQYLAALAILLLIFDIFVSYRKNRYLSALNEFAGGKR